MRLLGKAVPSDFYGSDIKYIYETKKKTRKKPKTSGTNVIGNEEGTRKQKETCKDVAS
jgi:hypothetical protein